MSYFPAPAADYDRIRAEGMWDVENTRTCASLDVRVWCILTFRHRMRSRGVVLMGRQKRPRLDDAFLDNTLDYQTPVGGRGADGTSMFACLNQIVHFDLASPESDH